ncbi:MAG: sigma-54 dependent transcriptional regulator [Proteobacteria bacterium]|nr:sigma-54 dependent transcriptional regulator [Pseudomonadota bacterium]
MASVLIIDDDKGMCYTLSEIVHLNGHKAVCAHTLKDGLETAIGGFFDVVFLDVMLPDGIGLDIISNIRETPTKPEVIIITSKGDPDGAELAIKNGAWDYVQKPSSIKQMSLPLLRAIQFREEKKAGKSPVALKREGIVGSSPQINACLDLLAQAAHSDANILITGETGTGKELFSRAIHKNSSRSENNFIVVDCTSIPETLVESTLFGHEKGAFTGAVQRFEGLIKQADGGTLFLDEVGELPLSVQKSFLRALQERRFRPLGGKEEVLCDFRTIAATNRNLNVMISKEQFRKDLVFRLRTFTIDLPPLRERPEDIKELSIYHMNKLCDQYKIAIKGFSPDFFEVLVVYDWPGNVRELFNALERALAAAQYEPTLFPNHLPTDVRIKAARASLSKEVLSLQNRKNTAEYNWLLPKLREFREAAEKKYLLDLIAIAGGDIKKACRVSGISRSRLYSLLKKHNLSTEAMPQDDKS